MPVPSLASGSVSTVWALLVLVPLGEADAKAEDLPADLTGTWGLVAAEMDGKRHDGPIPVQLTIKGDAYTMESGVPFAFSSTATGTLKLAGADGKVLRIDTKYKVVTWGRDGKTESDGSEKALWELVDKDTLRICYVPKGERPAGFDTKEGDGRIMTTFRRLKK
jgi:uncharacterized protein (TIGR03067 family)